MIINDELAALDDIFWEIVDKIKAYKGLYRYPHDKQTFKEDFGISPLKFLKLSDNEGATAISKYLKNPSIREAGKNSKETISLISNNNKELILLFRKIKKYFINGLL